MNGIQCPRCANVQPEYANYCSNCGESLSSINGTTTHSHEDTNAQRGHSQDNHLSQGNSIHTSSSSNSSQLWANSAGTRERGDVISAQTLLEDEPVYSVEADVEQLHTEDARPLTWQKVLDTPSPDLEDIPVSPRPTSPRHRVALLGTGSSSQYPPPVLFFWLSVTCILILSLASVFGVLVSFSRDSAVVHAPTLIASSNIVAIGATVEVHGSNFTPHGRVGLTRDAIIPIADTGGASILQADRKGNITDTLIISPDWQAGIHTINAEDAKLHKIARFSLLVTGKNASLRPAHFTVSSTSLDLGTGDSATNSIQTLSLGNTGGGQITWQASSDAPWLALSPDNGTFTTGMTPQVSVAVDRSNLRPGPYTAHINFLSNGGNTRVTATMQVIPLVPGHEAVIQLNPAVLSFTAPDGGAAPPAQTLTLSNPGVLPLQWSASTDAPWLNISPNTGGVQNTTGTVTTPGITSQTISVGINTSTLLPGTYNGKITFTGQGQVKNSPQVILVSVTITPQCSLQVSPSMLSFAGVYQQIVPVSKTITVGASQGSCSTPLQWSATSSSSWLVLSTNSGTTPASPTVSVNSSGLQPGTYNSSIVFTTSSGTQTLPVSFSITQTASPIMNVSPAALSYTGVTGQGSPAPQSVVVSNSTAGILNWQASVSTSIGNNWLSIAPSTGSISGHQSSAFSVSVNQSSSLPAGTYNGTVTVTGTDSNGNTVPGSPQFIPVSFVVQSACTVTAGPSALAFTSIAGQVAVPPQTLTISAGGACAHGVAWTASSAANWLVPTPAAGTATLASAGTSSITIASSALKAGSYTSNITILAMDSVTHQSLGAPEVIPVTLTVQQACTLQAPSVTNETFTAPVGQNPAAQSFTLGVSGGCSGNITITPTLMLGSGTGWLTVTPASATVLSGGSATFTVTVISKALKSGSYGGSISLAGISGGAPLYGSPQTIGVSLTVTSSASLAVSTGTAGTHGTGGVTSQPVNIANTGTTALNWTASLSNAPSFVSLGTTSGTLAAGSNTSTGVVVDPNAKAGNYTANVTIAGTDAVTGLAAAGSPTTITITISIAPPSMGLSTTGLNYSTPAGSNPAAQTVNISNIGGGTLTWTAGPSSASWLSISPTSGSAASNNTVSSTFSVNASGLAAGTYTATVTITPSAGPAATITVTLTVTATTPTPTPTSQPTPTPTVGVTPTPTPTTIPTPTPTPTSVPTPTPTPTSAPTSAPTPGSTTAVTPTKTP